MKSSGQLMFALKQPNQGAYQELTDENQTKVFIITDIARVYKMIGANPIKPTMFDILYDMSVKDLERFQNYVVTQAMEIDKE